jgi:hypothetical protein
MKLSRPIIIFGIVVSAFGLIFHLQGQAIVGPETSFMYSNPEWITYGQQIAIIGIVIIALGFVIKILKKG